MELSPESILAALVRLAQLSRTETESPPRLDSEVRRLLRLALNLGLKERAVEEGVPVTWWMLAHDEG